MKWLDRLDKPRTLEEHHSRFDRSANCLTLALFGAMFAGWAAPGFAALALILGLALLLLVVTILDGAALALKTAREQE